MVNDGCALAIVVVIEIVVVIGRCGWMVRVER